jgi:hypothetical protein
MFPFFDYLWIAAQAGTQELSPDARRRLVFGSPMEIDLDGHDRAQHLARVGP